MNGGWDGSDRVSVLFTLVTLRGHITSVPSPPLRVSVTHLPSALATRSPGRFPPFPLRGECNEGSDETGG